MVRCTDSSYSVSVRFSSSAESLHSHQNPICRNIVDFMLQNMAPFNGCVHMLTLSNYICKQKTDTHSLKFEFTVSSLSSWLNSAWLLHNDALSQQAGNLAELWKGVVFSCHIYHIKELGLLYVILLRQLRTCFQVNSYMQVSKKES